MSWQDVINGIYELCGGFFIFLSIHRLLKDKKVKGVSILHTAYFSSWGLWNLYYYPHLEQWASFVGGIGVVSTNILWFVLMLYYIRKEKKE